MKGVVGCEFEVNVKWTLQLNRTTNSKPKASLPKQTKNATEPTQHQKQPFTLNTTEPSVVRGGFREVDCLEGSSAGFWAQGCDLES